MRESIIKRFQILGLKNYRSVDIVFNTPYKLLVGENGLGKTTILDVFYYLLTRKWGSLEQVFFDFIELELPNQTIEFSQSELEIYVCYLDKTDGYINDDILEKFEKINEILINEFDNRVIYLPIFRNIYQQLFPFLDDKYQRNFYSFLNRKKLFDKEAREIFKETVTDFRMIDIQEKFLENINSVCLEQFQDTCNKYLEETKFIFSKTKGLEVININNDEKVELQHLSSGEKQIINIFSKFFFSKRNDLIFLIDEPELSLSLNWQKKLLPDVLASNNCDFLFAITHSPFIFNNDLKIYAEGLDIHINKRYHG